MIQDLRTDLPTAEATSDVCIVGAGAAGITLAVLLSRAGRSVTLLEAGGEGPHVHGASLDAELSGLAYRGTTEGRAHRLGGTTTLWGGQILPLGSIDFERRPWVPGSGWPLRRADLQRFYDAALKIEGLEHAIASDDAVWARIGERRPLLDEMQCYFSRWCPEPNFAVRHAAVLQGDRVKVWLHARAVRLEYAEGLVRGVVARTPEGREHTFAAKRVVFCLGTIESIRFFLQPREHSLPWNESGLLGCHFQDHIDCDAATLVPRDPRRLSRTFDAVFLSGLKYMPKLRLAEGEMRRKHLLNVGATVYSQDDSASQVRQDAKQVLRGRVNHLRPASIARAARHAPALLRETWRYAAKHRGALPTRKPLTLRVHCEQEPTGFSRISLSDRADATGMLRAQVHWAVSDTELHTIRSFTESARRALADIAEVVPHPDLLRRNREFVTRCQDSFHHMGGMRMDTSPRAGVVDEHLRLHGTRNCYVCSAAVFPTSGFSNPTHTLLALAVRLAEHLSRSGA